MPIVVTGIVDGFDMREPDETDNENPEQRSHGKLHGA